MTKDDSEGGAMNHKGLFSGLEICCGSPGWGTDPVAFLGTKLHLRVCFLGKQSYDNIMNIFPML